MRKIKFRGKKVDNGEWVYGYYVIGNYELNEAHMIYINCIDPKTNIRVLVNIAVIPESVGQFTELYDKNMLAIYEGDIVKVHKDNEDMYPDIGYVKYNTPVFQLVSKLELGGTGYSNLVCYPLEVIGNITDNPELLEVK